MKTCVTLPGSVDYAVGKGLRVYIFQQTAMVIIYIRGIIFLCTVLYKANKRHFKFQKWMNYKCPQSVSRLLVNTVVLLESISSADCAGHVHEPHHCTQRHSPPPPSLRCVIRSTCSCRISVSTELHLTSLINAWRFICAMFKTIFQSWQAVAVEEKGS